MGDHRLPKRVMSGELENAGKCGPGGKEKEWTDCVADDLRLFGVTGDWRTADLTLGRGITRYAKGVVGLWPRGRGKKKMRPTNGRRREKRKRRTRLRLHLG